MWELYSNEMLVSEAAYIDNRLCLKVVMPIVMFTEGCFWEEEGVCLIMIYDLCLVVSVFDIW